MSDWIKLRIGRGSKEALVFFSTGKAQYVRFTSSFVEKHSLKTKKSVDIFLKRFEDKLLIGFGFKDDKNGTLKFSVNDIGAGYISGSSLFKELETEGIDRTELKKGFPAREETAAGTDVFVIEVSKN